MTKEKTALLKQRLDKWLWVARFFKTRRLASEAISGGKVHVNNQRVKSSKDVKTGDSLQINKAGYHWEVSVQGLNAQRRPASEAALLFEETAQSAQKRQELTTLNKDMYASTPQSERPNKKQRRQIHRFKQV